MVNIDCVNTEGLAFAWTSSPSVGSRPCGYPNEPLATHGQLLDGVKGEGRGLASHKSNTVGETCRYQ